MYVVGGSLFIIYIPENYNDNWAKSIEMLQVNIIKLKYLDQIMFDYMLSIV